MELLAKATTETEFRQELANQCDRSYHKSDHAQQHYVKLGEKPKFTINKIALLAEAEEYQNRG